MIVVRIPFLMILIVSVQDQQEDEEDADHLFLIRQADWMRIITILSVWAGATRTEILKVSLITKVT